MMVYVLQKFHHYLLGVHVKMFTNHTALKYLVNNPMLGGISFNGFYYSKNLILIVKPRRLNTRPNHLSRIESGEEPSNIKGGLPDVQLFRVGMVDNHYKHDVQFLARWKYPKEFTTS